MAGYTFPHDGYNGGSVSMSEFEALTHTEGPDGVIGVSPTDQSPVYADGVNRQLWLRAGKYIRVRGRMYYTGLTDEAYPLSANTSGVNRTDLLVARLTRSTGAVTIEVKQGTTALTQDVASFDVGVYEVPLASAIVANGATAVPAGNVTSKCWFVNEDGIILCTPSTRPPHAAGRRCYESTSSGGVTILREILSDSGTWWGGDWINLVYNAGFTSYNSAIPLAYRRNIDGSIELRGWVQRTSGATWPANTTATVSTVPAAIRPSGSRLHAQIHQWGAGGGLPVARLEINNAGALTFITDTIAPAWVAFDGFKYHLF